MGCMHDLENYMKDKACGEKWVNFYTDKIFSIKSLKKLSEIYGRRCPSRYRRHKNHKIGMVYIIY